MKLTVTHNTKVLSSPRVTQMSSMFDVAPTQRSKSEWHVDAPIEEKDWNIGLIVGPSGAGKSSVARAMFGDKMVTDFPWSKQKSLLDDFPKGMAIKDIVGLLGSVGFNSPPAWLRPFHTLSVGEQFRVTCARSLAETKDLVVIDEFTSTVDRQVAQIASSTIAKAVRKQKRQLVAVTCHYDVADWLQPDWVYEPHAGSFLWRRLHPRPQLEVSIHPVKSEAWRLFAPYHYMNTDIHKAATCFGAFINGEIVAFTSYVHFPHPNVRDIKMLHRTVVLPDWQGLGLSLTLTNWLGQHLHEQGFRARSTTAHPAMIAARLKSPRWRMVAKPSTKTKMSTTSDLPQLKRRLLNTRRFVTYGFEYAPPKSK